MSRLLVLLLAVLLVTGCSARADPAAPSDRPDDEPSRTVAAFRLDRVAALRAVRSLSPRGFARVLTCASRRRVPCRREGTETSRWLVATLLQGARLPGDNGLREIVRPEVTAWSSADAAAAYAVRLTKQLTRYDGDRSEIHLVTHAGWRGTVLRQAAPAGGRAVLRRGRYVADLEWVARDQRTDRRLSHLPRRLLRALR